MKSTQNLKVRVDIIITTAPTTNASILMKSLA